MCSSDLRRSAARRGALIDGSDDDATIRSAGDDASIGDDATATSDISDADLDIEIDFFEGLGAQIGSSDAALAPRQRSALPQYCCAAGARPFYMKFNLLLAQGIPLRWLPRHKLECWRR